MYNFTCANVDKIVDMHFWKSKKEDLRTLVLYERNFNKYSFCNPLHIINHIIEDMTNKENDSEQLEVKVCKWFPNNSLSFIYTIYIRLIYVKNFNCFKVKIHNYFNQNYETYHYLSEYNVTVLFKTIYEKYIKKIVSIKYEDTIHYTSNVRTFSIMNEHVKKLAIIRIEEAWKNYKLRIKQKHYRKFKNCLLEILLIPRGGYDGKRSHIIGGLLYWEGHNNFITLRPLKYNTCI
jgi:hypothetical protein